MTNTCQHLHDTGDTATPPLFTGRDYCVFHLRYRVRQLRIAQYRARNQRFDLKLPPIESMATVLSAVNQLLEAVAADMIDLKRAEYLLKTLRFAAQALKNSDKWRPSVYHTDVAAPAIDLAAEYGLPDDLDLNTPPEVAFPTNRLSSFVIPSEAATSASRSRGALLSSGHPSDFHDRPPLIPVIPPPVLRDYTAEVELAMSEVTPQDMELTEMY